LVDPYSCREKKKKKKRRGRPWGFNKKGEPKGGIATVPDGEQWRNCERLRKRGKGKGVFLIVTGGSGRQQNKETPTMVGGRMNPGYSKKAQGKEGGPMAVRGEGNNRSGE